MKVISLFLLSTAVVVLALIGDSSAACPDPFCDSVTYNQCPTICPAGDIPFVVTVKDSCGQPVCDPDLYLDFSNCPVEPCPNMYPSWPIVFPTSCDPTTGEHVFTLKIRAPDCLICSATLFVHGQPCNSVRFKFLDKNSVPCVDASDFYPADICSDYNCDGAIDATDQAFHDAHIGHCCDTPPCTGGPVICDSIVTDPCLVICPLGDIVHTVVVKDSCGNPVCLPDLSLDFSNCPAEPCPNAHPNWPFVPADSCDPATGTHYFSVKASSLDCVNCQVPLVMGATGQVCTVLQARFLDINNDKCVFPDDMIAGALCNDYNCDGVLDGADVAVHNAHLDHCCAGDPDCPPGPPFCDSVFTDPCLLICPAGDVVHEVVVKDSCGNPLCVPTLALNFSQCKAEPCPGAHPDWPLVYADSCDPATGTHFFSIKASSYDCTDCRAMLQLAPGQVCQILPAHFLDINNDNCVTPNDFANLFPCNDYDCDGGVTSTGDYPIHLAHLDHCCDTDPCAPGPPLCDSVTTDPCVLICPSGDITHIVNVKDSCGNPYCDTSAIWMDFSQCAAEPCPNEHPFWPRVFPDSCDPATGDHFFTIRASSLDCIDCRIMLFVNGKLCRYLTGRYLDVNNDKCVTPNDWLGVLPCNDYDCDGVITPNDLLIHQTHLDHCCTDAEGSLHGHKWHDINCNGIWEAGEPPLAGWTINLYQGITLVATTVTNAAGEYWFMGLPAAQYRVYETVQPGWVQTFPPTVFHLVNLPLGGAIYNLDFGNQDTTCQGGTLQTEVQTAGTMDNFMGSEPASPGPDLVPLLTCPLGSTNVFDTVMTNQCFGHTFTNLFDTAKCCLVGARLCLRVRATGSIPSTDAINIANDGVIVWGVRMNVLQSIATGGADPTWSFGDTLTMCLDLANLPPSSIGVTNVLAALQDGDLDILIQDDTEVDYLSVRMTVCCEGCCDLRGDANNDGAISIADLTHLVNFLFQGGPPPPCFEEGDVNNDGIISIADLTYMVNFLFQGGAPPIPC